MLAAYRMHQPAAASVNCIRAIRFAAVYSGCMVDHQKPSLPWLPIVLGVLLLLACGGGVLLFLARFLFGHG